MKWTAAPLIAAAFASSVQAAEPPPPDEEFLEYLANYEDKNDNWTVVAPADQTRPPPASTSAPISGANPPAPARSAPQPTPPTKKEEAKP